jgi:hypothetical protein
VEVRAGFSDDDLLLSQRTRQIDAARAVAAEWKDAVMKKGGLRKSRR